MREDEAVVYGVHAALAVARHRPDAILRVFHDEARRKAVGPLLKAAAARRRPYREVGADELEKIAGSVHHEGVVVVCRPLPLAPFDELRARLARERGVVVALDDVGNPHNLGAIIRSSAWFGAKAVLFPAGEKQATLSASAVRIAQGGAEVVPCCAVPDLAKAIKALRADGFDAVCADPDGVAVAPGDLKSPIVLVLGNETSGVRKETRQACARTVRIPGSGAVESLNVSVAAGVLLSWVVTPSVAAGGLAGGTASGKRP